MCGETFFGKEDSRARFEDSGHIRLWKKAGKAIVEGNAVKEFMRQTMFDGTAEGS